MFTKKPILLFLTILLSLFMISGTAAARQPSAEISTGFTYQGRLTVEGAPADGTYDFEFTLFDGSDVPVGSPVNINDVPVAEGLFTVQLDFGEVFDGGMRYLEIRVRPGGSDAPYTTLSPRQGLTPAPSAIYAASAPWSGLTGIPDGFDDGVDNDTTYTAGDGLELDGTVFKGRGTSLQNVVIVAKSGGDFTSIQTALDSIVDASIDNPYLVYVAPGVYTEQVTMKEYVDIEGAGELTTKITFTNSSSSHFDATLVGANNAELRFLTVENNRSAGSALAILNRNASPRLTHVTASASEGGMYKFGIINENSSPIMTNVKISASGAITNYGIFNENNSNPTMTNVTASASGTSTNYGVFNSDSSSTMTNVTISASGGTNNYGIYIGSSTGTHTILVTNSKVTASNSTIYHDKGHIRIGASQLSGGDILTGDGSITCIGVYDENYNTAGYNICP